MLVKEGPSLSLYNSDHDSSSTITAQVGFGNKDTVFLDLKNDLLSEVFSSHKSIAFERDLWWLWYRVARR